MPRIKVTRCILVVTIISLLGFLSLSLWMDSTKRSKKNEEEYINLLFKSPTSSFHQLHPSGDESILKHEQPLRNARSFSPNKSDGKSLATPKRKLTLMTPSEVQTFWSYFNVNKPWFMKGGSVKPDPNDQVYQNLPLWPSQDPYSDRVVNQLMFIPTNYEEIKRRGRLKKIFLFHGRSERANLGLPLGRAKFLMDRCPVNTCELTIDPQDMEEADAIFFKNWFQYPNHKRNPFQVWILFLLEAPPNTQAFYNLNNVINWTATFRHDSDLVAPYEKYYKLPSMDDDNEHNNLASEHNPYHSSELSDRAVHGTVDESSFTPELTYNETITNENENDRNKIAWFVSNCGAKNSRLEYARELARYIQVDIYGSCGTKRCPRSAAKECFDILNTKYKYYLAFENSNCIDYITEKFFVNGLMNNVIPIVMGARKEDYVRGSPAHSFIHVDDFESPKDLAIFLHHLNRNPLKYESYLKWKQESSGEFINTYFWCRLCALLYSSRALKESHSYPDIHSWWNHPGTCSNPGWRKQ